MVQMARDNESLFTNLKVTSFGGTRGICYFHNEFDDHLYVNCKYVIFSRQNRYIRVIGKRCAGELQYTNVRGNTSMQLRI